MLSVSIVIPTFNRLERLRKVLAGLEAQDFPRTAFEVIVVSDGSTDGTDEYLRAGETSLNMMPVIGENAGVATARNEGAAQARAPLVLFVDDDVVPSPQLVGEHVRTHDRLGAHIAVLGPMLTPPGAQLAPWVRWEQSMLEKQYGDIAAGRWRPTARQFYTGNSSLDLDDLRAAGGFNAAFRRAEDVELAYRLAARGVRFVYNPDAIGYHHVARSFRAWLEIPYAYGRSDVMFSRDLGQAWLFPRLCYEFRHHRHPMVRGLVRLCLDRPALSRMAMTAMQMAALAGGRLGSHTVPRMAYSGMFNLRNYQGVADELGGRKAFFAGLAAAADSPVPGVLKETPSIDG